MQPRSKQYRPISCAECRRLKLRCNRVFPCSSCKKRGCDALCPDGILPPRKLNRNKISNSTAALGGGDAPVDQPLAARVRELEHALATLQATYSTTPHPLLTKDLRTLADGGGKEKTRQVSAPPPTAEQDDIEELSENLGTLSMTGYGQSRFIGTVGAIHMWTDSTGKDCRRSLVDEEDLNSLNLPPEIIYVGSSFLPVQTPVSGNIADWIVANLPPSPKAWSLCETFFENGGYIFVPVWRTMFIEDIFSAFYSSKPEPIVDIPRGHRLALLLMVFSIGDMLDLTKPAQPTGGKRFYYLARAALALEPLFERPTLTSVQAIMLMVIYLSMSDQKDAPESAYILSGINLKLSLALGLHREWRKFSLNQQPVQNPEEHSHVPKSKEEELRRVIFLEVIHFETWIALQFGRPSLLHFSHFDCGPPGTTPERNTVLETRHMKCQAWTYTFLRECLVPVLDCVVAVKPWPYSDILKLDAKLRNYKLPNETQIPFYEENLSETGSRAAVTLRFSLFSQREILLLYLHRQYFTFAMRDSSIDPLSCPFLPSILASFRAACGIVGKISLLSEQELDLSVRIWIFWNQLFVPCVFGTIVIRSPGCQLAPTALAELDKICELLQKAKDGYKPSELLPHAVRLRDKARSVYNLYYSSPDMIPPAILDISSELVALGGKSRASPNSSSACSPESQQDAPSSQPAAANHVPPSLPPGLLHLQPEPLAEPLVSSGTQEISHFMSHDWELSDIDSLIQTPNDAYQAVLDGNHSNVATDLDPTTAWWNELDTLYQTGSLVASEEQLPFMDADMQPTWLDIMTQIMSSTSSS